MRGVQGLVILEVWEILGEKDRGDHQLDLILHDMVLREVLFVIGVALKAI